MKKTTKILALVMAAVLLVGASVMGTLAYLTGNDTVTNTFTVGNVEFEKDKGLDEALVNEYGQKLNKEGKVAEEGDTLADRVKANEYKLIPGHEYVKDPTVHLKADSEKLWLFVKVEVADNIEGILVDSGEKSIADQMTKNGWEPLDDVANVYVKGSTPIEPSADSKDFEVFGTITVKNNADVSKVDPKNDKIIVNAYIVQADGFDDAAAAWNATFGAAKTETPEQP